MPDLPRTYPCSECTDEELLARFKASRDEAAFRELYNRYFHLAKGVALKFLKDEEDSNEVTAKVFAMLYEKIPSTQINSFNAYLYTTVRNECYAFTRQRRKDQVAREKAMEAQIFGAPFMENEGYRHLLNAGPDLEEALHRAIDALSEPQQKCIKLFFFQKKSYSDIQHITGYSFKQVKSYLQNGKRNLRIALEKFLKSPNL